MPTARPAPPSDPDARTRHFGAFYGLDETTSDRPVVLVVGNCQAESLRIMLDAGDVTTVRMPAVHELTEADLPYLEHWLSTTDALVTQPIRDDYRGLPLGSRQLAELLPAQGRLVRIPVVRFAGLYPTHAIIRPPSDPGAVPPVVEYHDLRILVEAAGLAALPALDRARVRAIAELSLQQLTLRERAHGTVVLSDLFLEPSFALMRTLNHPGNPIWTAAARRVRSALGWPERSVDPGRPLLDSVHAPREEVVVDTWGTGEQPTTFWTVGGQRIEAGEVREAHLRWYSAHPGAVEAGLTRHADALAVLSA